MTLLAVDPSFVCLQVPVTIKTDCLLALPLILKFGSPRLREIVGPIFAGKKFSCLAVTEAFAGSDVANIRCHATRVSDGWIVNGSYVSPFSQ